MKYLVLILIAFIPFVSFAQNNIIKGSGVCYFDGPPTVVINTDYHCEVGIDTATGFWYEYSRDAADWILAGFRIQLIGDCLTPSGAPVDKESEIVLNPCDSLWRWRSGAWHLISGGGGGGGNDGIAYVADYQALKAYTGTENTAYVVADSIKGFFKRVSSGTVDSALIFDVAGAGTQRWQRLILDNRYKLTWWVNNDTSWSDELQRAIDIISDRYDEVYGSGILEIPTGLYYLDTVGADPYDSGDKLYCVELKSNVTIEMDAGAILKMSDDMITNGADSINRVNIFIGDSIQHVTWIGGIVDGNADGQYHQLSPVCGYYGQMTGIIVNITNGSLGEDYWNTDIRFEGVDFRNHSGNPFNCWGIDRLVCKDIRYSGCGEGWQILNSKNVLVDGVYGIQDIDCGDGFEALRIYDGVFRNLDISGPGTATMMDMCGHNMIIENFNLHDYNGGGISLNTGAPPFFKSDNVIIRNGIITDALFGMYIQGDTLGRILIENVVIDTMSLNGITINPNVSTPQVIDLLSITDCRVSNCDRGLYSDAGKNIEIVGGSFSNNTTGIEWHPQIDETAWTDNYMTILGTTLNDNSSYGLNVTKNAGSFGAIGFAEVYATRNGLQDIVCDFNDTTLFVVRNVKPFHTNTGGGILIEGEQVVYQISNAVWQLAGGTHGQIVVIHAVVACTIFDKETIGGPANIEIAGGDVSLSATQSYSLIYDANTQLWYPVHPDFNSNMTNWLLAASGTGGTESITNNETVTVVGNDGIQATRSGGNINLGIDFEVLLDSLNVVGQPDSVFAIGDSICIVESSGDTLCVAESDSAYITETEFCVIIMGDTTCVSLGVAGVTLYTGNGAYTNTPGGVRIINQDSATTSFRRGTQRDFEINGDNTNVTVEIYQRGSDTSPALRLNQTNFPTTDIGLHWNGLSTDEDYWIGLDDSDNAFVFAELNGAGDNFFKYYGALDRLDLPKALRLPQLDATPPALTHFQLVGHDTDGDIGSVDYDVVVDSLEAHGIGAGGTDGNGLWSSSNSNTDIATNMVAKVPSYLIFDNAASGGSTSGRVEITASGGTGANQLYITNSTTGSGTGLLIGVQADDGLLRMSNTNADEFSIAFYVGSPISNAFEKSAIFYNDGEIQMTEYDLSSTFVSGGSKITMFDDSGNLVRAPWDEIADSLAIYGGGGVTDHGALTGLTDDDHPQYFLLAGRSSGQIAIGGTGTTDDLTLRTTAGVGASGADMIFQVGNNGATEAMRILNSGNVGIGVVAPAHILHIGQVSDATDGIFLESTTTADELATVNLRGRQDGTDGNSSGIFFSNHDDDGGATSATTNFANIKIDRSVGDDEDGIMTFNTYKVNGTETVHLQADAISESTIVHGLRQTQVTTAATSLSVSSTQNVIHATTSSGFTLIIQDADAVLGMTVRLYAPNASSVTITGGSGDTVVDFSGNRNRPLEIVAFGANLWTVQN